MQIPIEIFSLFIGSSIALAIFGFLRNPQIPATLAFAGIFILTIAVTTDSITIDSFLDGATETVYSYNVESFTGQLALNSGGTTAHAEFVSSSSSQLLNDKIDCIDILLRKSGSPTGTATIGTLDGSANIIQQFGTIDVSTLTTSNIWYRFCLGIGETYTIQNQDRLGIKFTGGNATNNIQISQDANNPFDGTITFRQQFTSPTWTSGSTSDLTMRFYLNSLPEDIILYEFEFTEFPKVLFALLGVILMLSGGLMVYKGD